MPKMKGTMSPVCHFFRELWVNKFAHVILTAEADSLSTDAKQLLDDCGLVGCHSNKGNYLSIHARIDSTRYVRLLWEPNKRRSAQSYSMAVALLMIMMLSSSTLTRASMTTKVTSVCDVVHLFVISATCFVCFEKNVRLSQLLPVAFHPFL